MNKVKNNLVYELRKKLNLTQQQMAEKLGVSFATVNRWENGHSVPSNLAKEKIFKLAKGEYD